MHTRDQSLSSPNRLSKKDRKVAKKAAKIASMPKVITTKDIDFVAATLHPSDHDDDANQVAEEERRLLEDPDIKLNLYYNKGTSNTREVRYRHLKHKQADAGVEIDIEESDLDALMVALKVPVPSSVKTEAERRLLKTLREAVRADMINVQKEHEQTGMRKAGFWRWASRKAYDRLSAHGRIWQEKTEGGDTPNRKDSAVSGLENDDEGSPTTEETIAKGLSTPKTGSITIMSSTSTSEPRRKRATGGGTLFGRSSVGASTTHAVDEWTTVGKAKPAKKPVGTLKLSTNGGIEHLVSRTQSGFAALRFLGPEKRDRFDDEE